MTTIKRVLNHIKTCDVLVAGGGTAGCFAAIKAAEKNQQVILVDKGHVGRSGCSPFAAGAINICYPDDDKDLWFEEIVTRGEYLNDQEWVMCCYLCELECPEEAIYVDPQRSQPKPFPW